MSHTELHIGKMREIEVANLEDWARERCHEFGETELHVYYENWIEVYKYDIDNDKKTYRIFGDKVFEMLEYKHQESNGDVNYFSKNQQTGVISFVTEFYNGGTCFSEIMEENVQKDN